MGKIARALGGFGAGFHGQGQQYLDRLDDKREQAMLDDSFTIMRQLQGNDISGARATLTDRLEALEKLGANPRHTLGMRDMIDAGNIPGATQMATTLVDQGIATGRLKAPGGQYSRKASTPRIDPNTGEMYVVVYDPNTGESTRQNIEGATGETPAQQTAREVGQIESESRVKARQTRMSTMKTDYGTMLRDASRSQVPLREALKYAQLADQGLTGKGKMFLSRMFPGIDVSDEAALDSNLKRLTMDELQLFKGPTTDFEYGVSESIVGGVGDSKTANIARLKSLDRSKWFARREFQQMKKWFGDPKKDPDAFAFDFNETISTKRGPQTLMDLQDTAVANNMTINEVLKELNK